MFKPRAAHSQGVRTGWPHDLSELRRVAIRTLLDEVGEDVTMAEAAYEVHQAGLTSYSMGEPASTVPEVCVVRDMTMLCEVLGMSGMS